MVTSLSVATALWLSGTNDGRWISRDVRNRVDFVVDGHGLSELAAATEVGDLVDQVTLFELNTANALAVLGAPSQVHEAVPVPERVPLLGCPCGDPLCGALTVKLSLRANEVQWPEWAWEDHIEPLMPLPTLPVCRFPADEYANALRDAEGIARSNREPMTRIRVRAPGPWWRNVRRVAEERTDASARLGWLFAEAVAPTLADADGDYAEVLFNLDSAQTLLAGSAGLDENFRVEAINALRAVCDSPHRISLPPITLDAVRWQLNELQR